MTVMSTTNASAIFADALAQLSRAFTEIENQARLDILEARAERDKVAKNLHAATLEAQGWKQAAIDAKATVHSKILFILIVCTDQLCLIGFTGGVNSMLHVANNKGRLTVELTIIDCAPSRDHC